VLFLAPGAKVYEGMIVGENSRDNDLEVRFQLLYVATAVSLSAHCCSSLMVDSAR
jgi:predicted membrane GTPase involved in stress response